ncbi:MAG: ROK family protein [Sphingomonadales bacterium]|nr:ROK family protein [Sphingomonadales bacterium]
MVAVGYNDGSIVERTSLSTVEPELLVPQIADYLRSTQNSLGPIEALGVGAFGPMVVDRNAINYGSLLQTNKPGWSDFDLASALRSAIGLSPNIVTDVAAAGIAEATLGALSGTELGIYLTVGTGIGGAIICQGKPLPALLHLEIGHIALQRQSADAAPSTCRFHPNCAEGLAAGPAIMARFGQSLSHFPPGSAEHGLIADYLGQLCAKLVLTLSPQRIVLGGGVGKTPGLIAAAHGEMLHHLGGYTPEAVASDQFICAPNLGQDTGIVGSLCLAEPGRPAPAFVIRGA